MTADRLRSMYIAFFKERGHEVIPSASLIPDNDPSVLFTTAGMHPLVPYLLGRDHASGSRLVDYQKCIRTTDIEEVGDLTHLTFFEMLGNWSLGDYYRNESIAWSFEFLTREDYLGIPASSIWVTVFAGTDDVPRDEESAGIWERLGIARDRIVFLGMEHNWWAVGDDGPCGPDTEIFIDMTSAPCANGVQCLPGLCSCGRFFEIWNNVFMSYVRRGGELHDLPKKNVDTGMGFERTLAALNRVDSVYETSALKPIVDRLVSLSSYDDAAIRATPELTRALRIITDHLKASVFILGDDRVVTPSNQGQGYVLRRLIRRAIRFCGLLGVTHQAWAESAQTVLDMFGEVYPELARNSGRIHAQLALECDRFERTLEKGTILLQKEIADLQARNQSQIGGETAFRLYDTYGFPIEFTEELAAEHHLSVDRNDYERRFAEHRDRSKGDAAKSGLADTSEESVRYHTATHLLHAALREILGKHVAQMGSNITRERMRFDFTHPKPLAREEIASVEQLVQSWIDADFPVTHDVMPYEHAEKSGAIGLFEDRYGNDVTVYRIGDVSLELCGGPHVTHTGEIGKFKIEKEQSSSAGVRRIRAVIS